MSDDMRAHIEALREAVEAEGYEPPWDEDRKRWRAALAAVEHAFDMAPSSLCRLRDTDNSRCILPACHEGWCEVKDYA